MKDERLYSVLLAPIVSEKSTMLAEKNNQVAFRVLRSATKQEVKGKAYVSLKAGQEINFMQEAS